MHHLDFRINLLFHFVNLILISLLHVLLISHLPVHLFIITTDTVRHSSFFHCTLIKLFLSYIYFCRYFFTFYLLPVIKLATRHVINAR